MEATFEAQVKKRLLEHEFHPICIEHEYFLKKARIYEKTEERKAQHKRYRQSDKGKASDKVRGKRYRDLHRGEPKHTEMLRAKGMRFRRKRKLNALWELMTYDGQRKIRIRNERESRATGRAEAIQGS